MADRRTKFKIPGKKINRDKISIQTIQQEKTTTTSTKGKPNLKRKKDKCNEDKHNSLVNEHSSNLDDTENKHRIKTDILPKHKKPKLSPAKLKNEDNCMNEDYHSLNSIIDYEEEKKYLIPVSNHADNSPSNVVSPEMGNRKVNDIKNPDSNKNMSLITDNSQDAVLSNHNAKCSAMEISFDTQQTVNKLKPSTLCFEEIFCNNEHYKPIHKEKENKMEEKAITSYTKKENECRELGKFEDKSNRVFTTKEQEINLQNENENESNEKSVEATEELKSKIKPQIEKLEVAEFCKGAVSGAMNEGIDTIIECVNPLVTDNNNLSVIPQTKSSELAIYKESNIVMSEQSTCFNQKEQNANLNKSSEYEVEQNSNTHDEMNESIIETQKITYVMTERKNTIKVIDTSNLKAEECKVKQNTLPNNNSIIESTDSDKRNKLQLDAEYKTCINKETIFKKLFTIPHINALEYDKQCKYNVDSDMNVHDKTTLRFINKNDNHLHFPLRENQCQNNIEDIHHSTNIESVHILEDKQSSNDMMNNNGKMNKIKNFSDEERTAETPQHLTEDKKGNANDSTKQIQVSDLSKYSNTKLQNNIANENNFSSSHQMFNTKSSKLIKELQEISKNIFKENIFDEKELKTGSIVLNENMEKDEGNLIPIGKFAHLNELFQYNKDTESVDVKNLSIQVIANSNEHSVGIVEDKANQRSDQTDSETKINNPNNIKNDIGNLINAPFLTTAMDYIKAKSEVILCKDVTNNTKNINTQTSIKSPQEITQIFSTEQNVKEKDEKDATKQDIKEKDPADFTETDDDLDMDDGFALTASQLSMLEANEKMEMHSSSNKSTSQQTDKSDYIWQENNYVASEIIKELRFLRDEMATIKKLLQEYVEKKK
ncbi:uncharacterized protein PFB0145c-like [Stegodyphus dumicola]|uniref:uncharacterized protein PFB0145c-like n=1 Tax=Stegodyphus dumicola TaxID=202533 RepID=UPI0015B040F8|nr:uncharacterized protein PFB0145c-like [Stegodyphus dumicola]